MPSLTPIDCSYTLLSNFLGVLTLLLPTLFGGLKNVFNIFLPNFKVSPPILTGLPPFFLEATSCTSLFALLKTTFFTNDLAFNKALCTFKDSSLPKLSLGLDILLTGIPKAFAKTL